MPSTLNCDEDLARRIEAVYATPDVEATRLAVFRPAGPRSGESGLDVGCRPGYLPDARVAVMCGQQHLAMYSDPALFVGEIARFIEGWRT